MSRATVGFLTSILLGMIFAGCLANEPEGDDQRQVAQKRAPGQPAYIAEGLPQPVLKCYDGDRCNQEMTPDDGRQGNEVTIAVNPTNPKNIVGGAKDYYPPDAGQCVWDGVYVTHDGGATAYEDRSFDGSPWRLMQDPSSFQRNYASQYWCTTDPVAYFSTTGIFYYLLMAYQGDPVTGSKTCQNECPQGALNDWAFNRAVQIVAVSDDGGDTFHTFTPTLEGSSPVAFHDKGWIAASASGTIHAMWLSGGLGNVYMRSTDGGQTYPAEEMEFLGGAAATQTNDGGSAGQGSFVEVGVGSEVYASWRAGGGIQFRRSLDEGATWEPQKKILNATTYNMPGISPRDRVRAGFPMMATDRFADSPFANAIYFVWTDASRSESGDIFFSASYDKGDTWMEPIILNDDFLPNGTVDPLNYQFFPAISVSPTGVIDVFWSDTRNTDMAVLLDNNGGTPSLVGKEHKKIDAYHTYSLDGGRTWSQNFRLRDIEDGGWDPQFCHHQNGMIFIGDYTDIDSSYGAAHPVWPDTRSGNHCDVYTAIIQRPIFPDGYDPTKKAALLERLVADGLVDPDHPFLE